jgi:hypothetical protein
MQLLSFERTFAPLFGDSLRCEREIAKRSVLAGKYPGFFRYFFCRFRVVFMHSCLYRTGINRHLFYLSIHCFRQVTGEPTQDSYKMVGTWGRKKLLKKKRDDGTASPAAFPALYQGE